MMKTGGGESDAGLSAGEPLALSFRAYGGSGGSGHSGNSGDANPLAPKLLILHGLFGSGANWRTIATRLSATHEVFCLDLRNHGRSPWHDDMEYATLAADVARFIADHQLNDVTLLGHSMGGKTAMTLAQNCPDMLSKLIVVDIAPLPYPRDRHLALIDALLAADLTTDRRQIQTTLAKQIPDPATRQFLIQNLTKDKVGFGSDSGSSSSSGSDSDSSADSDFGSDSRYHWRLNLPAIRRNLPALAGYENDRTTTLDTLFIAGADSNYLPPTAHPAIHTRFPNAHIKTLPNAGHWLHAQQPDQLVDLCNEFLGR